MAKADVDVVLKSIHDPSCVYLHQHVTTEGVDVAELVTDIPEGWDLPQAAALKGTEDRGLGAHRDMLQNHLSEVHTHMSSFMANMSSLAKIADPETFDMVMKTAA